MEIDNTKDDMNEFSEEDKKSPIYLPQEFLHGECGYTVSRRPDESVEEFIERITPIWEYNVKFLRALHNIKDEDVEKLYKKDEGAEKSAPTESQE